MESFNGDAPRTGTVVSQAIEMISGLEEAFRREPSKPENAIALAEGYSRVGRYNAATRPVYAEALRHVPANATFQKALSISYLVEGIERQVREARQSPDKLPEAVVLQHLVTFGSLAERHPSSVDICKTLADLEMLAGKGYDAINRYEQALRLGWSDPESVGRACRLAVRRCGYSDDVLLHVACLLEEMGAYEDAVAVTRAVVHRSTTEAYVLNLYVRQLEEAMRRQPDATLRAHLRIDLSQTLQKLGRLDEAMVHLRECKPGEVTSPPLVKQLARLLIRGKDFRAAFDHLQNIPLDDEAKTLVNDITLALESQGEIDTAVFLLQYVNANDAAMKEAMEIKERAIELDSELQLAELHAKNGRFDDSFRKFIEVIESGYEPAEEVLGQIDNILARVPISSYGGLLRLGRYCVEKERHQQAIHYLNRVLQAYPDEQEALRLLRLSFDKIIERHPNIPELRFKSARLYRRMGDLPRAVEEFERSMTSDELKMRARREMALAYLDARQHEKSLEQFGRMRIEEEDCEPLYGIYEHFRDKNPKKALDSLALIRRCNPQYRDIMAKIAALEERLRKSDGKLIEDPKMKELIGNLAVGRYRYIGKIGSGGMGIVHKVFDMKNNSVVAMKILREGLQSSGKAIDRFYREARIAAKLNHRNIVNIFDYSINNVQGHSYITMEFVDGPSLRDIIEKKFAASIDVSIDDVGEALYYMSQLCDALYATHTEGIIHRDIKPDNILVNSEGIVKITDFGIVHVEEATFTPTGAMVGTPRYMSPEQIQGKKLDGRSDLYAAGIILYELLVGNPPFISGDISYQHIHMDPTPPADLCPAIPKDVSDVILRCLAKKSEDRYIHALAMREDIDAALENINERRSRMEPDTNRFLPRDFSRDIGPFQDSE
jgi:tetratricopeptide (TPR) repeat protein